MRIWRIALLLVAQAGLLLALLLGAFLFAALMGP